MLDKGAACLRCRKLKTVRTFYFPLFSSFCYPLHLSFRLMSRDLSSNVPCRPQKCNGAKPQCSRCHRLSKDCAYSAVVRRRPLVDVLEAQSMELELLAHKLTIPSAHSLSLLSKRLQERIEHLGNVPKSDAMPSETSVIKPANLPSKGRQSRRVNAETEGEDASKVASINQNIIERELHSVPLEDFHDLPSSLSDKLISLFLPFSPYYCFRPDIPRFRHCLSLPASDPESIHPCLLNACYLGACASIGGGLARFTPIFLRRARHFLQQSLMFADRPIHFLWASGVVGIFLGSERRLAECLAFAGGFGRLALACGLNIPSRAKKENDSLCQNVSLLPPPKDKVEVDERVRLEHSISVLGHCMSMLGPHAPAFTYDADDDEWAHVLEAVSPGYPDAELNMSTEEVWHFELHMKFVILKTFGRVRKYAQHVLEHGHHGCEQEYRALENQADMKPSASLQLLEKCVLPLLLASNIGTVIPLTVLAHPILYGSGLILHSLRANEDAEAKRKMLHCVQSLVEICDNARGNRRLHVSMVNAVSFFDLDLLFATNALLQASYCERGTSARP
ncbi:hypothetical protein DL93DRAFT_1799199 [Clavulina sp. PMI_390]|nr:hypothetical protein DL93DRAFT_1799199 [Clavulina sp. PMI_390]